MRILKIVAETFAFVAIIAAVYGALHLACAFSDACAVSMGWML